jgi:hypothetical protein
VFKAARNWNIKFIWLNFFKSKLRVKTSRWMSISYFQGTKQGYFPTSCLLDRWCALWPAKPLLSQACLADSKQSCLCPGTCQIQYAFLWWTSNGFFTVTTASLHCLKVIFMVESGMQAVHASISDWTKTFGELARMKVLVGGYLSNLLLSVTSVYVATKDK